MTEAFLIFHKIKIAGTHASEHPTQLCSHMPAGIYLPFYASHSLTIPLLWITLALYPPGQESVMLEIPFEPCPNLFTILPLTPLRTTPGVIFDSLPSELLTLCSGAERVIHSHGAISPGSVGSVIRPWYCHRFQDDHLMVLAGSRLVELYTPECGEIFSFRVSAGRVELNGETLYDGAAIVRWRAGVFHRIESSTDQGSASFNFSVRHEGFDIRREFDIYDLNIETGESKVIRPGYLDQPDLI